MKRKLLVALIALIGMSYKGNAQSFAVTAGPGIIGAGCTNCGLTPGIQFMARYAFLEKITGNVGADYYFEKDDYNNSLSIMYASVGGSFYIKEKFKGFYIGPDLGYMTWKLKTPFGEYPENQITFGLNLGWDINIADLVIINPHIGYGTWYENSKGRVDMGLRIGAKF